MSLTLIVGPMFAGKTSELFSEIERKLIAGRTCVVVKYQKDKRYDHMVPAEQGLSLISRNGNYISSKNSCTVVSALKLSDLDVTAAHVIGVSEIQFYEDAVETITQWLNMKKIVIAEGLNGDFMQRVFPIVGSLVAMADKIISKKAVCNDCHGDASFTIRKNESQELILVGSDDIYKVVCGNCLRGR